MSCSTVSSVTAAHNLGVKIGAVLRLLRPKQWTKNLLVFAALVFTRGYEDDRQIVLALLAFAAMCLVSSAVYAANDAIDAPRDRQHPKKRERPIAAGEISPTAGLAISMVCLSLGAGVSLLVGTKFLYGVGFYVGLQLAYSMALKAVPVLDVFLIATGFVLRAALGAVALSVGISGWLLFCTGALALMLGFAKRRHEFHWQGEQRGESRPSLTGYTQQALDALVVFAAAGAALSYGVYAIESDTARRYPALILTIPIVLYGIMRYLFLVFGRQDGGEPENVVFGDSHMIVTLLIFLAVALLAMSGLRVPFIDGS